LAPGITGDEWYVHVITFRYHWYWRQEKRDPRHRRPLFLSAQLREESRELSINEMDDASAWATCRLNRNYLRIEVDFPSGRINVRPSTLVDWLVLSLIECRRNLAICARESCPTPYFVKTHPRTRYCSPTCFAAAREAGQRRWEKENRSVRSKWRRKR
jgi:hypothetical protein